MPRTLVPLQIPKESQPNIYGKLSAFLNEKLSKTIEARSVQIEQKMTQWESNYQGIPKTQGTRTTPFVGAANFVPGLIRMHVDIMHARIQGLLWGVKPFWKPTWYSSKIKHEWLDQLSEWMDYKWYNEIEAFDPVDAALHDVSKLGVCILKPSWVERQKFFSTQPGKMENKTFKKMELHPIGFGDFLPYPITARTLKQCTIKFHKLRFTREEVEFKKNTKEWSEEGVQGVLRSAITSEGSAAEKSSNFSGIFLSPDVTRPYQVVEAWLEYELTPGQMHSIVVVFNPQMNSYQSIIRAYYHPIGLDQDAFIDFRLFVKNNSFYPDSIPQLLEDSQEEKAQIHNTRRDASTIGNVPTFIKKRFADVGNPKDEWYPGKVFEVDNMDDLKIDRGTANYNSMMEEERYVDQDAEKLVGNPPPSQGFASGSMGKRGVYNTQGTLALMAAGNDRLDNILRRARLPFHRIGRAIYEGYRDFGDEGQAQSSEPDLQAAFSLQPPQGYEGTFFGLGCSDAGANRETQRTALLLMGNTMAGYYGQVMQLLPQVVQAQGPVQELMLEVLDGAKDLATRLLTAFDIPDRTKLVPDLRNVLAGKGTNDGPPAPNRAGVPGPEAAVQQSDLQDLSSSVAAIAGATRTGASSGGGVNGRPPV